MARTATGTGFVIVALVMGMVPTVHAQFSAPGQRPVVDPIHGRPIDGRVDPASDYLYDDGTSENLLGLTGGGTICWLQYFETPGENDTINEILAAFGSPAFPGFAPPNGTPAFIGIWNDPSNDGNPSDAVLLATNDTTIRNVDTDRLNTIRFRTQVTVNRGFFVGVWTAHEPRQFVAPVDQSQTYVRGRAWVLGDKNNAFDPTNLMNNGVPPVDVADIGMPGYFLLRATTGEGLTLQALGPCPAEITLLATGATPGSQVAFFYSFTQGSGQLQVGPCAGIFIDLDTPILLGNRDVDSSGRASAVTEVIEPRCGGVYFQALDLDTCQLTSVVVK